MNVARRFSVAGLAARQVGVGDDHVLLVPGFTGSKEDFDPILPVVAAAGFTVTAIDLPGQYESAGPDDEASYGPHRLAGTLQAVAEELGAARIHLLGHSFGGLVARAAVLKEPDRFDSLVLMDSGPSAITGARLELINALEPALARLGMAGLYDAMNAEPGPERDPDFLRVRFVASSPIMLAGMAKALRSEPDRTAELARTDLPILVLFGVDDDAWPPEVQRAMAAQLGARTVAIANAKHSPAVENPPVTARELIAFWSSVLPQRRPRGSAD